LPTRLPSQGNKAAACLTTRQWECGQHKKTIHIVKVLNIVGTVANQFKQIIK
jgi:hypothetical protein